MFFVFHMSLSLTSVDITYVDECNKGAQVHTTRCLHITMDTYEWIHTSEYIPVYTKETLSPMINNHNGQGYK